MKRTDAHPGRPFAELTAAAFDALARGETPDPGGLRVVWDWDERTSRGSRRRPAMHVVGLVLSPDEFRPGTGIGADFDEEGNAEGVYYEDGWDVSAAGVFLETIGNQDSDHRFLIALWLGHEAYVGVLSGGEEYTNINQNSWFEGVDWSPANPGAMPPAIAGHPGQRGVTIVALDTRVPSDRVGEVDSAGLYGLRDALTDLVYDCPFEVLIRDYERGAPCPPNSEFDRLESARQRLTRLSLAHGRLDTPHASSPHPFEWFLIREGLSFDLYGHLLAVSGGTVVVRASAPGDDTWDEMRGYGIVGGFDRVVIADFYGFEHVGESRPELFSSHLPKELVEHNANMIGAIRSVGAQALDTRLQDLQAVWEALARWEGPVLDDAETSEFVRAYAVPGSDWPTRQQQSSPSIVWIGESDGNRPRGYLEGLAAAYHADRDLLEINAEFPAFVALHTYWTSRYWKTVHPSEGPERLQEIDYEVSEVVREWCEQTLVEVVVGVNQLAGRPGWDERRIKAALCPEALSGAAMAIHHVQQSIRRSLGQRLGSLKEVQTA